jgi:regulator of replication initiation timing
MQAAFTRLTGLYMDIMKYIPPSLASVLAGFAIGYWASWHFNSDRIALLNDTIGEVNSELKRLREENFSLSTDNSLLKSSLFDEENKEKQSVPKDQFEAERQSLENANKRIQELSSKLNMISSEPLPPVEDTISLSSTWTPWDNLGPYFKFDGFRIRGCL